MLPKCLSVLLVLIFVPIGVSKSQSLNYIFDICVLFVGIEKIIVTNIYIYYVRFCRSGFIRHFPNGHPQPNGIDLNPKCPFDVSMSYEHEQLNTHPHPTTSILLHAVFLTVPPIQFSFIHPACISESHMKSLLTIDTQQIWWWFWLRSFI